MPFHIQCSFKINEECTPGWLASACGRFLFNYFFKLDEQCFLGCLASPCGSLLRDSYSKLVKHVLLAALPPPAVVSYSILIQKLMNKQSSYSYRCICIQTNAVSLSQGAFGYHLVAFSHSIHVVFT